VIQKYCAESPILVSEGAPDPFGAPAAATKAHDLRRLARPALENSAPLSAKVQLTFALLPLLI
jgi:hypothetical protein